MDIKCVNIYYPNYNGPLKFFILILPMKKLGLKEVKGQGVPMACPAGFWYITDDFLASKLTREKGAGAFK